MGEIFPGVLEHHGYWFIQENLVPVIYSKSLDLWESGDCSNLKISVMVFLYIVILFTYCGKYIICRHCSGTLFH